MHRPRQACFGSPILGRMKQDISLRLHLRPRPSFGRGRFGVPSLVIKMNIREIRDRLDALLDKKEFTSDDYKEAERLIAEMEKIDDKNKEAGR